MRFTKMQGIGNDYVYVDCTRQDLKNPSEVSRLVSHLFFLTLYQKNASHTRDIPYIFIMLITICAVSIREFPLSILHFWIYL